MIVKGKRNARRSARKVMSSAELRRRNRRVMADEDIADFDEVEDVAMDDATVDVAPEASELLFEAQDVAELIAEVTEKPVEVSADEDVVTFSVDGVEYTVESDGAEEVLEARQVRGRRPVKASRRPVDSRRMRTMASRRMRRNARPVSASTRRTARRPVKASSMRTARPATSRPARQSSVKASAIARTATRRSARPARPSSVRASRRVGRVARRTAR